jgi:hypothetical protein
MKNIFLQESHRNQISSATSFLSASNEGTSESNQIYSLASAAASKRHQNKNIERIEDIFTDIRPAAAWASEAPLRRSESSSSSLLSKDKTNSVNANGDVTAKKVLLFLPDSWGDGDLKAEDTVSSSLSTQAPWAIRATQAPMVRRVTQLAPWDGQSIQAQRDSLTTPAPWASQVTTAPSGILVAQRIQVGYLVHGRFRELFLFGF